MVIPFPTLKTERLELRQIQGTDAKRIHFFRSDTEMNIFIKRTETQTFETAVEHIEKITNEQNTNKSISWGITIMDSHTLIGSICLWNYSDDNKIAELGYNLDPKYQGKGIMTESLKVVVEFGFQIMKFDTIEAFTDYGNLPSRKLLEKNGFMLDASKKDDDNENNIVYFLKNPLPLIK